MAKLERKILEAVGEREYRPVMASVLAQQLQVTKKHLGEFHTTVEQLVDAGKLFITPDGLLRGGLSRGTIRGMLKKTLGGFGFVTLLGQDKNLPPADDIYIGRDDIGDALTGDEVSVKVLRHGSYRDGKLRGKIVEVLQRSTKNFVGTYFEHDGQGYVQIDGTLIREPVRVGDPGAKGARPEDKVVIEMLRYPTEYLCGEGVLTRVLGPRGTPGVDTLSIIHEFNLPDEFPEDVLEEARIQAQQFDETNLGARRDLSAETIITIDPVDARDFDDAISLRRTEDGHWHLGVHIADVAHFVPSGSRLDAEAYRRGTSVYLPDRVLPMLPEVISNGLASLQQGRTRLTQSAFMEFTAEGVPLGAEFVRTAICTAHRFAYEEVMPVIRNPDKFRETVSEPVRQLLGRMYELAMLLRARRFARGALELTMPEVKLDFDDDGRVTGAHTVPHDPSHQIIEEFMLAANEAVATALNDREIPFLRRVHANPDELKMRAFAQFVTSLGFPLKRFQSREELQKLLDRVKDSPHQAAVNYALLRSMKQAEYSPEPLEHYALAIEHYCHFTSPIRRYPDLLVHRLLTQLLTDGDFKSASPHDLVQAGIHCSKTERRAEQAERELVKIKLLSYMQLRIGEEFSAIVTGVQEFGLFCQLLEIPAEGLVHVTSLDDDYYYYEQATHTLAGRRSGRQYRLGDRLRVVAARVDIDRRQLDFRIAGSRSAQSINIAAADKPLDEPGSAPRITPRTAPPAGRFRKSASRGPKPKGSRKPGKKKRGPRR